MHFIDLKILFFYRNKMSALLIENEKKTLDKINGKISWALTHGIIMATRNNVNVTETSAISIPVVTHAPFSFLPFQFPATSMDQAIELATFFNELIDKVSRDNDWLIETLSVTCESDTFTSNLMDIFKEVVIRNEEPSKTQKLSLGIHRSDYMQHSVKDDDRELLQVEINTIASSFGGLSSKISDMQRAFHKDKNIPVNGALSSIALGIYTAHINFCSQFGLQKEDLIVIMVVQPNERNFSDQQLLVFELLEKFGITCIRTTLKEIHRNSVIESSSGILEYFDHKVSVVYFRAGYSPDDYPSEEEWKARVIIEKSFTIKCPNIGYHLAGTKKVQQALSQPGVLERYFSINDAARDNKIQKLRRVFAGLYSLDPPTGNDIQEREAYTAVIAKAIENPELFVMKPQREGGGNNFCDGELSTLLSTSSEKELSAYILMERIFPSVQPATLIRDGNFATVPCVCELGIFSIFLGDGESEPLLNNYGGYLLRVKPSVSAEGGVAAGYAVLSSPELI